MNDTDVKEELRELRLTLTKFQIEVSARLATLEVKSGVWGAIAGISVIVLAMIIHYIGGIGK